MWTANNTRCLMSVVHTCSSHLSITICKTAEKPKKSSLRLRHFSDPEAGTYHICNQVAILLKRFDENIDPNNGAEVLNLAHLKLNFSRCYFNEFQLPATAQAQCLQHAVALAYLAQFFSFHFGAKSCL